VSVGGKIRFLLFILGICCIVTALSLQHAITSADLLNHEANVLQENLSLKEKAIDALLQDKDQLREAQSFSKNGEFALHFIDAYRSKGINLLIYKNGELQFWSASKINPVLERIRQGTSLYVNKNGSYELIRKDLGNVTFVFFITIKTQYAIENQYLRNEITSDLLPRNSLMLADFTDKDTQNIFSRHKEYLFSVKLNPEYTGGIYTQMQAWLWIIGVLAICFFVQAYCTRLMHHGRPFVALLILTLFFSALRLSDLEYAWLSNQFNSTLFSPAVYAQSDLLPSLGAFLLNMLAITWVFVFAFVHRPALKLPEALATNQLAAKIYVAFALLILCGAGFLLDHVFFGLIDNSTITFDITNIVNLSFTGFICILILYLAWFNLFLCCHILIDIAKQFQLSPKRQLSLFLIGFSLYFLYELSGNFTAYFIIYALFILVLAWNSFRNDNQFAIGIYILLFLCTASLSTLKYVRFIDIKERSLRKGIAQKLMRKEDPKVIASISAFEHTLANDTNVINYFKNGGGAQRFQIHNYITKNYLDGYLSRLDNRIFEYNTQDAPFLVQQGTPLATYKALVQSGALKIQDADYFYHLNDTFGFQQYFGIIPIFAQKNRLGSIVIELTSQPYDINSYFPELLIDGKLKSDEDYSLYSFAFYKDNALFSQSGKYTYETITRRFRGEPDRVVFENENHPDYNHAVSRQDKSKVIVISKERMPYTMRLATLSFFFLVFIVFSLVLYGLFWLFNNILNQQSGWFKVNRYLMINANKILYKTRIQVTIVLAVVATLLIVGWTTFYYIRNEYLSQQEDEIREKTRKVQLAYEKMISDKGLRNDEEAVYEFNRFADVNAAFLNLYDLKGNIYITSLPKMFEYGVIVPKMGAKAFVNMHLNQKSEYINPQEKIGDFVYAAGYAPIRNANKQTVAYIGLPYYRNEIDYQEKIGLFINTLINIYALVFVLIGILAVFLANQITHPLTFIQEVIRKTKLGERNQPIVWHRQDEIGMMIKEYNKMLAALEASAIKLARSERESAWREMAKQVAHEIKNPLTPLKLGAQLLERAWREQDPNFEKKFASFNKSFIEQIDSLATIASEFSNFAKMPDTRLEPLALMPVIEQTIRVFNSVDHIDIILQSQLTADIKVLGDKDQLLRSFNNLLKNAIEATENRLNGLINIRVYHDEHFAFVEVEDNGKGIDEALKEKIFTPNFTTKSSGTGLGLAFVKQAVENAGGTIRFSSALNRGTLFYLSFPLLGYEPQAGETNAG